MTCAIASRRSTAFRKRETIPREVRVGSSSSEMHVAQCDSERTALWNLRWMWRDAALLHSIAHTRASLEQSSQSGHNQVHRTNAPHSP